MTGSWTEEEYAVLPMRVDAGVASRSDPTSHIACPHGSVPPCGAPLRPWSSLPAASFILPQLSHHAQYTRGKVADTTVAANVYVSHMHRWERTPLAVLAWIRDPRHMQEREAVAAITACRQHHRASVARASAHTH